MSYSDDYLEGIAHIAAHLNRDTIDRIVEELYQLRERRGRLFIIGNGGSAANASHAVNDFRKICRIDAMTPTDNVAELTARVNDDGWPSVFSHWLQCSHMSGLDALLVLSVGGGSEAVSPNIANAVDYANHVVICRVLGIVGRSGGMTARRSELCLFIPAIEPEPVTAYVESFQSVVLHLITSHPRLQ